MEGLKRPEHQLRDAFEPVSKLCAAAAVFEAASREHLFQDSGGTLEDHSRNVSQHTVILLDDYG